MYAKKALGQHFLMHASIAERMVQAAGVTKDDVVVEIGPGKGLLTKILLENASKVVAIETDADLIPILQMTFVHEIAEGRLILLHTDVRTFDPSSLETPYKLVANIPYYITGEILRQFLGAEHKPASLTLLVQKEVAERIARSKKESLLSLSVKAFGQPKYQFTVPKGAFVPAPKIDSAVLTVDNIRSPFENALIESRFFEILHAGFAHKRKQLAGNLEAVAHREKIDAAFKKLELQPKVRAEDIPLETWLALTQELQ